MSLKAKGCNAEPARFNYPDYVVPTYNTTTTVRVSSKFGSYDIIEKTDDPLIEYLADICTLIAILIGSPAIFIPAAIYDKGLSIGIQVLAAKFHEKRLLSLAHSIL